MECELLSPHPNNNLVGLYFHEIMRYFSSIVVRKEINKYRTTNSNEFMEEKIRFGYRDDKPIYSQGYSLGKRKKFISFLAKSLFFIKGPNLYLGDVSINNYKIIISAFFKGYKVSYLDPNNKVFIDKFEIQNNIFISLIKTLCDFTENNFDSILRSDINNAYSIISPDALKIKLFKSEDIVLIGTPGKVNNRVNSINAFYSNAKVIGVLHADESGSDNGLSWKYDDRSNCTHLLGYGPYGDLAYSIENRFLSLSGRDYFYIQSDSEICRKIYTENKISRLCDYSDINKQKGLYISRRIGNISVINSYPIIDPLDYVRWQKNLLKKFPNIFVKQHPKQSLSIKYDNQLEKVANLSEIVIKCDYDFFITDNVSSTSFALIAATNKPIIYFNIENPDITSHAIKSIKKRVLWVDIDIFNNFDGFDGYKKINIINNFQNSYTPFFSLSKNNKSRIGALLDLL